MKLQPRANSAAGEAFQMATKSEIAA